MPITQDDMIAVIEAGLNFKQAYQNMRDRLKDFNSDILEALKNNKLDQATVKWQIFYEASLDQPERAVPDEVLLLTQHEHYRKFYRNNILHAKQAARKRAAKRAGIPVTHLRRDPNLNITVAEQLSANEYLSKQLEGDAQRLQDMQTLSEEEYIKKYIITDTDPTEGIDVTGTPFERTKPE